MLCPCRRTTPMGSRRHERTMRCPTMSRLPVCASLLPRTPCPCSRLGRAFSEARTLSYTSIGVKNLLRFGPFNDTPTASPREVVNPFPVTDAHFIHNKCVSQYPKRFFCAYFWLKNVSTWKSGTSDRRSVLEFFAFSPFLCPAYSLVVQLVRT